MDELMTHPISEVLVFQHTYYGMRVKVRYVTGAVSGYLLASTIVRCEDGAWRARVTV